MAGGFLVRALRAAAPYTDSGFIGLWFLILILVLLQMPTTLRPILGTAETLLPTEKAFFLEHGGNQFDGCGPLLFRMDSTERTTEGTGVAEGPRGVGWGNGRPCVRTKREVIDDGPWRVQ